MAMGPPCSERCIPLSGRCALAAFSYSKELRERNLFDGDQPPVRERGQSVRFCFFGVGWAFHDGAEGLEIWILHKNDLVPGFAGSCNKSGLDGTQKQHLNRADRRRYLAERRHVTLMVDITPGEWFSFFACVLGCLPIGERPVEATAYPSPCREEDCAKTA